jgi:osmotically-inducible protein OsmY
MRRSAGCALVFAILTACTTQQAAQTQHDVTAKTQQSFGAMNRAISSIRTSDAQLKVRVEAAIAGQAGVNVFHVSSDVRQGVVTLTGSVPTTAIQQTVVKAASGVSGVKRVISRLRVGSD